MKMLVAILVVILTLSIHETAVAGETWTAHCKARHEVPPTDSRGQCQANFKLNQDGTGLEYRLIVAGLEFVTQAHIHMAQAGLNGGVVAFLFGFVPEGDSSNGVLAQGVITDGDLVGDLAGQTIMDLMDAMDAGNTYVNVHTQSVPSGEVRGQIK